MRAKTLFPIFMTLGILFISILACRKDFIETDPTAASVRSDPAETPITRAGSPSDTFLTPTILGAARVNPYTTTVMTQAWNELHPDQPIAQFPASKLYVKFTPANIDDVIALGELDEMLYDYPLEYEVIQMGITTMPAGAVTFNRCTLLSIRTLVRRSAAIRSWRSFLSLLIIQT